MLELDDLFMSHHAFATVNPPAIACLLIQTDQVKNMALGYLDTFRYTIGWITFVDNEIYSNLEVGLSTRLSLCVLFYSSHMHGLAIHSLSWCSSISKKYS